MSGGRKKPRLGRPVTRQRCNCGGKGKEYLIRDKKMAWTMYFCHDCEPKFTDQNITRI